jgi:polysaccharide pyruvyl transferase WcaK-like protein
LKTINNSPIIPFYKGNENKSKDVWQKHLNKISICKNMQESYEIYTNKKIDLNLASRLHSIILSQVYEIDFIAVSYSTKTDETISYLSNQNLNI